MVNAVTTVISSHPRRVTFSSSVGMVTSAYGREGDVIGEEGDYNIDQMSDVDTSTATPSTDNVLQWDGVNWVAASEVDAGVWA